MDGPRGSGNPFGMTDQRGGNLPFHWIGVEKGWQQSTYGPIPHLVSLPPKSLRTHALAIGATGSGKTNLLHHLIAQDVVYGNSFVVLDFRGDLAAAATEICAGRVDAEKVRILDLRERDPGTMFDPLSGAGEPYFRALGVLDAVASESESWGVQLAETLRNALMLLAEVGEPLTSLEPLLVVPNCLSCFLMRCKSESVVEFWRRYASLSEERRLALAMPVLNKVSILFATEPLRNTLGGDYPIDLRAHLDMKGGVLLVSLAAEQTHGAGRMMGKILLSSICREIFGRVATPESRRNPVRLYVDEFEHFGEKEFENILAEGRRFGLSLVLAHQTLAQLAPRMRSMILNNVGAKFAFRCGREDAAVLSRDLTGDPKELDLARLGTGEAVISIRGQACREIEVNAPIVRNVGARSRAAERLANAARAAARNGQKRTRIGRGLAFSERGETERARTWQEPATPTPPPAELEDWLCG